MNLKLGTRIKVIKVSEYGGYNLGDIGTIVTDNGPSDECRYGVRWEPPNKWTYANKNSPFFPYTSNIAPIHNASALYE